METYKAGQGSLTRLITWMVLIATAFLGCVEAFSWFNDPSARSIVPLAWFEKLPVFGVPLTWTFIICVVVFFALIFVIRHFLNKKKTVDTLVETEQEMKKVSWPTRDESLNATWVVLAVTFILTLSLWLFDGGLRLVLNLVF